MVTPVNLQLAHWNLEHTAQQTRDPAAVAGQAARQGEGLAAAEHRDASVQPTESSAEEERLGRKKRREEREKEGGNRGKGRKAGNREKEEDAEESRPRPSFLGTGKFDLYA